MVLLAVRMVADVTETRPLSLKLLYMHSRKIQKSNKSIYIPVSQYILVYCAGTISNSEFMYKNYAFWAYFV